MQITSFLQRLMPSWCFAVPVVLVALETGSIAACPQGGGLPIQSAGQVTFSLLASAPFQSSYRADQVRRFLDSSGSLVELQERITVQGNGTESSPFRLDFVDQSGAKVKGPAATLAPKWDALYSDHAGLLFLHSGFRVHDPVLAQANYSILDFGIARRAGRDVRRIVVFPSRPDKAIWVVDVDTQTGIPLYSAEFDPTARLIGEVEITALSLGSTVVPQTPNWSWSPRMTITNLTSPQQAAASLVGASPTIPGVGQIMPEYALRDLHVAGNALNASQTLVFGYTDGIDEFFVSEAFGASYPFAPSPMAPRGAPHTHTIASYDDPGLRAYVFHESGVTFEVIGRGSLRRLQDVAKRVCHQAVTGF
jgi:hypothetical protein